MNARELSIHEAAHAVIAVRHGVPVDRVSILARPDSAGRCELAVNVADVSMAVVTQVFLAGAAGLRRAGIAVDRSIDYDLEIAHMLCESRAHPANSEAHGRLIRHLELLTACDVDARWDSIQRVAAALRARGTLGYLEFSALVDAGS